MLEELSSTFESRIQDAALLNEISDEVSNRNDHDDKGDENERHLENPDATEVSKLESSDKLLVSNRTIIFLTMDFKHES